MAQLETFYLSHGLLPTGFSFLFVVLPVFLLVFYLAPPRLRPAVLLVQSLLYYLLAEPQGFAMMVCSILFDYAALRLMQRLDARPGARRALLWLALAKSLGLILWLGLTVQLSHALLRLGLQVYTLSAVGCLLAAYRRQIPYERNLLNFALYCCFFPRLYAGPLLPCHEFCDQLDTPLQPRPLQMLAEAGRFVQGAFKAAVFGRSLFVLYRQIAELSGATALAGWMQVFTAAFALYFVLSGLCDIAQGLGGLFGITLPKNFYYPYQSRSVEDFFDRFNITVGRFLREVLPAQSGAVRRPLLAEALYTLLLCMLAGLWFGLSLNYLLWGAYLAVFILLERHAYPKLLQAVPTLFCRVATLCVVLLGFAIFCCATPAESAQLIRSMLDFGNLFDRGILHLLSSNWILLLVSCLFATNAFNLAATKLRRAAPRFAAAAGGVLDLGLLVLLVALTI